jgi:hypothetical protein
MLPGINRLDYDGDYWPEQTVSLQSVDSTEWLQSVLWLVVLPSRPDGYDPLKVKNLTATGVKTLAKASTMAWDAICAQDKVKLGKALLDTMDAWAEILPETVRRWGPQGPSVSGVRTQLISHFPKESMYSHSLRGSGEASKGQGGQELP